MTTLATHLSAAWLAPYGDVVGGIIRYDLPDGPWICEQCGTALPDPVLIRVAAVRTLTGTVVVGEERPLHRCATLTQPDELRALRYAHELLQQQVGPPAPHRPS